MGLDLKKFLSESKSGDGSPSASRLIMFLCALTASAAIILLVVAIFKIDDAKAIALIGSLPLIIGALAAFIPSAYAVNKVGQYFDRDKDSKSSGQ